MSVTELLRKVAVSLSWGRTSLDYPTAVLTEQLNRYEEPKTDLERSFYQYKCQMFLMGKPLRFLMNCAALPLLGWYMLPRGKASATAESVEAVFIRDDKPENILPQCLRDELQTVESDPEEGFLLLKKDRRFIGKLLRQHPVSWLFALKNTMKIGRYRYFIQRYQPKKLVVCNEYSYTSSVMTSFCEENGIELINVMHGEKLLEIESSFFRFHRCYVWDDCYADLFRKLRAEPNQFVVAVPESLMFKVQRPATTEYDYTYYFQAETPEEMKRIHSALEKLAEKGARISLRPHPRYTDMEQMKTIFPGYHIENYREVSIEQSVLRTGHVVSVFSTVLQQAYHNGVAVVIDDISCPHRIRQLVEWDYIMLSKEHELLSNIIGE